MKKLIAFYPKLSHKNQLFTFIFVLSLFFSPSLSAVDVLIGQYDFTTGADQVKPTSVMAGITLSDIIIGTGISSLSSFSGDALVTSNWNPGTAIASPNFKTVQFTITKGISASEFNVGRVDVIFKRSAGTGIIQLNYGTAAYPAAKTYAISNVNYGTSSFATYSLTENTTSSAAVTAIPAVTNATPQYIAFGAAAANTSIQLTIDKIEVYGTVAYAPAIGASKASISLKASKGHSLATPVVINGSNLTDVTNVSLTGAGASYFSIDNASIAAATLNAGTTPTINVTASSTLPIGTTTANLHLESAGATSLDIPITATCDLFYEDFSNYDATANSLTTIATLVTMTNDVSLSLVSGWLGHNLYQYKAATPNFATVCLASTAIDLAYLTTPEIDLSQPFKVAFKSRNLTSGAINNPYKVYLDGTELMYEGLNTNAVLADLSSPTFKGTSTSKLTFTGQNIAGNNILFDAIVVNNSATPDMLNLPSPKTVNFGNVAQGAAQTINIPISACNLSGDLTLSVSGTDFSLPSGTNVLQAAALAGTTIPVMFTATAAGAEITATLTIASTGMTSRTITLKGTPVAANIPVSGNTNASSLVNCATCDLSVASGAELTIDASKELKSVTVAAGGKLTLSDTFTLTATSGITLQNSASGTASFVDNRSDISPTVIAGTVEQAITEKNRNWYVAVPVSGQTAAGITLTGSYIVKRNESGVGSWDNVTGALTAGVGYIAIASANAGTTTWSMSGNLNSGRVQVGVTRSGTGFNLLGNPYPSYLNWEQVLNLDATNASILQPTIWYRTAAYNSGASKFDYTFNTYNSVGRVATPTGTSGYIPPTQAFWVRANSAGTVTFTNAMRSHGNGSSNLLKAPKTNTKKIIRIQVSNNANSTDETVLYFDENALNSFDSYDSQKMFNNLATKPEIFTKTGNEQLVINGLRDVQYDTEIPLGFVTGQASDFSISRTEMSNFEAGTRILLKDKLNPASEFELTDGVSYNFSSPATPATTDRFSLLFRAPGVATDVQKSLITNSQVFVNAANQITIIASEKSNYAVYNAVGQQVSEGITKANRTSLNNQLQIGIYLVKVANNNSTRVIIK